MPKHREEVVVVVGKKKQLKSKVDESMAITTVCSAQQEKCTAA